MDNDKYTWYNVKIIATGQNIIVRQEGDVWVAKDGFTYTTKELDFNNKNFQNFLEQMKENNEEWNKQSKIQHETLLKMYESMDAKAIADHQAEIDEKKFWCNLRSELFKIYQKLYYTYEIEQVLDIVNHSIDKLYEQNQEFLKKNFNK